VNGGSSDNLDKAAELQQLYNDANIARVRAAAAPETNPDFDGETCVACGTDMIPERLAMGRIRCVLCQTAKEKLERLHLR
jgi:hypothetical protein